MTLAGTNSRLMSKMMMRRLIWRGCLVHVRR